MRNLTPDHTPAHGHTNPPKHDQALHSHLILAVTTYDQLTLQNTTTHNQGLMTIYCPSQNLKENYNKIKIVSSVGIGPCEVAITWSIFILKGNKLSSPNQFLSRDVQFSPGRIIFLAFRVCFEWVENGKERLSTTSEGWRSTLAASMGAV